MTTFADEVTPLGFYINFEYLYSDKVDDKAFLLFVVHNACPGKDSPFNWYFRINAVNLP